MIFPSFFFFSFPFFFLSNTCIYVLFSLRSRTFCWERQKLLRTKFGRKHFHPRADDQKKKKIIYRFVSLRPLGNIIFAWHSENRSTVPETVYRASIELRILRRQKKKNKRRGALLELRSVFFLSRGALIYVRM